MAEAAAEVAAGTHLPEQPVQALRPLRALERQELALRVVAVAEVDEDRPRLEDARLRRPVVERGDLAVRVDGHEAAAELVAADLREPRVVLEAREDADELLEEDRHFHAVRRAKAVELDVVVADRQRLLLARARRLGIDRRPLAS
jgi:hypothetical protein